MQNMKLCYVRFGKVGGCISFITRDDHVNDDHDGDDDDDDDDDGGHDDWMIGPLRTLERLSQNWIHMSQMNIHSCP